MNITYNNKTPEEFDCWLATRPIIIPSEVIRDRYQIAGRRGELIGLAESRSNAHISFMMHQTGNTNTKLIHWNWAKQWLREEGHNLILSDDADYYYDVRASKITAYSSPDDSYRRMEVDMEVYPFKYKADSDIDGKTINVGSSDMWVMHTDICEPLYSFYCIEPSGTITINTYTFNVFRDSSGNTTQIDVRRKTASNEACVDGNYDKMVLREGANSIETSAGVTVTISKSREGFIV